MKKVGETIGYDGKIRPVYECEICGSRSFDSDCFKCNPEGDNDPWDPERDNDPLGILQEQFCN